MFRGSNAGDPRTNQGQVRAHAAIRSLRMVTAGVSADDVVVEPSTRGLLVLGDLSPYGVQFTNSSA